MVLWQLGNGIISNRSVTQGLGGRFSYIIQHTAQIDGGNSGGPLLIRNTDSEIGYDVIGVNSWSARRREGTNFSIPTAEVMRFLDSIDITQTATVILDEDKAAERMRAFASIVNSRTTSYKDILPFVSIGYMLSVPAVSFVDLLRSASRDASTTARYYFRNVEPFEAFRVIIADAIWQRRNRALYFEALAITDFAEFTKGNFLDSRGRSVTSVWRYEDGDFFMVDFGGLDVRQRERGEGISGYYEGDRGIFVRGTTARHELQTAGFEFGFTRFRTPHFGFIHTLGFNLLNIPEIRWPTDPDDFPFQRGFEVPGRLSTFGLRFGFEF